MIAPQTFHARFPVSVKSFGLHPTPKHPVAREKKLLHPFPGAYLFQALLRGRGGGGVGLSLLERRGLLNLGKMMV